MSTEQDVRFDGSYSLVKRELPAAAYRNATGPRNSENVHADLLALLHSTLDCLLDGFDYQREPASNLGICARMLASMISNLQPEPEYAKWERIWDEAPDHLKPRLLAWCQAWVRGDKRAKASLSKRNDGELKDLEQMLDYFDATVH